jgi:serine/threonine-protein kinase
MRRETALSARLAEALVVAAVCAAGPLAAQCPDGAPAPCRTVPARPAPPPDSASVAVLFFENVTGDTADAYVADGLTDAIITRLAQAPSVHVKSRGAVARLRGRAGGDPAAAGRRLRVMSLVTGAVRRAGNRLRITVELTRAETGVVLWSDQFTRGDGDLLGIEEEVARSVAREVAGKLLPRERATLSAPLTRNRAAYEHFLRGNYFLAQRNPVTATAAAGEYGTAARLDTAFSEALARQAVVFEFFLDWGWSYQGLPAETLLARGFSAADRALVLNPLSSDAWLARALLLAKRSPRTFEGVEAAFARALALDSSNPELQHQFGVIQWQLGRDSAAIRALERALELEPGRSITFFQLALSAATMRQLDESGRWLDSAIASDPTFAYAFALRAYTRAQLRDLSGARADARHAREVGGPLQLPGEAALAGVDAMAGDTAGARGRAATITRYFVDPSRPTFREGLFAASALVAAGNKDGALQVLESVQPRGLELWSGLRLPVFDPLRADPRFIRLMEDIRPPALRGAGLAVPPPGGLTAAGNHRSFTMNKPGASRE